MKVKCTKLAKVVFNGNCDPNEPCPLEVGKVYEVAAQFEKTIDFKNFKFYFLTEFGLEEGFNQDLFEIVDSSDLETSCVL